MITDNSMQLKAKINNKAKELKSEYVKNYGALCVQDTASYDTYKWIDGPWPWEKGGNA